MKKRRSQLPRIYISPAGWLALALGVIIVLLFFFPPGTPDDQRALLPFYKTTGQRLLVSSKSVMRGRWSRTFHPRRLLVSSAAPVDVYVLPFGDNGGEATVADFPRLMEAIEKGQGPANALASLKGETQGEIALPARTFTFGYIHYLVLIHAPAGNEVTVVTSFR